VFGSVSAVAAGVLVIDSGVLPRWLGWVSILVGLHAFERQLTAANGPAEDAVIVLRSLHDLPPPDTS
jgi:hypothetical protein